MKQILIFLITIISLNAFAQKSPQYTWGIYGGGGEITTDIKGDIWSLGKFEDTIQIGNTSLISKGSSNIVLTKTDNKGSYLFTKRIITTDSRTSPTEIIAAPEGGVYFTCSYYDRLIIDNDTFKSKGIDDLLLAKLDNSGNLVWAKSFGSNSEDWGMNNLAVDKSGNIYMNCMLGLWLPDDTIKIGNYEYTGSTGRDIYVVKLTKDGDVIWVRQAAGKLYDSVFGIVVDEVGNVYSTGCIRDTVYFDGTMYIANENKTDLFLSKYDPNGNLIFVKLAQSTSDWNRGSIGLDITLGSDGFIYLCGLVNDTTTFDNHTVHVPKTEYLVIAKYDTNGNVIWVRADIKGHAGRIATDADNNIYSSLGYGESTLVKYDSSGKLIWENKYGPHKSGANNTTVEVLGLTVTNENKLLITGMYDNLTNTFGKDTLQPYDKPKNNIYIAEVKLFPASIEEKTFIEPSIKLYPNPNSGYVYIEVQNLLNNKGTLTITDVNGRAVYSKEINQKAEINMSSLSNGVYFVNISSGADTYSEKIIKQ